MPGGRLGGIIGYPGGIPAGKLSSARSIQVAHLGGGIPGNGGIPPANGGNDGRGAGLRLAAMSALC
jgi:hypothetical protein